MLFAVTTEEIIYLAPSGVLVTLPAGRPVVISGHDGTGDDRTYMVETEHGEVNEAVPGSALDFEADF